MSTDVPTTNPTALRALAVRLSQPTFRKAFDRDPVSALERVGVDPKSIPHDQLEALAELSADELRVVANLHEKLNRDVAALSDVNGGIFF